MDKRDAPKPRPSRAAERLVVWLTLLFFVGYGWSILLTGGLSIKGKSGAISFLSGNWALLMVGMSFFIATLMSFMAINVMGYGHKRAAVLLALILMPPAVFVLRMVLMGKIAT